MVDTSFKSMCFDEFQELSRRLACYYQIFYKLWSISRPVFVPKEYGLPTACVTFDREGNYLSFLINEDFWSSLSMDTKLFIICHECYHILFNHGGRTKHIMQKATPLEKDSLNRALDITINEMLSRKMDRKKFDPNNDYCYVDTIWQDKKEASSIPKDQNFFFYYDKIVKDIQNQKLEQGKGGKGQGEGQGQSEGQGQGEGNSYNDHGYLSPDDLKDALEKALENDSKETVDEIQKEIKEITNNVEGRDSGKKGDGNGNPSKTTSYGNSAAGATIIVQNIRRKKLKKWETVIKDFERRMSKTKSETKEDDVWHEKPRRFPSIKDQTIFLPNAIEQSFRVAEDEKPEVWFFLDASGSCYDMAQRFFNAVQSVDRRVMDVRLFSFDTETHELNVDKPTMKGGGGTSFTCIEETIKRIMNKEKIKKHPHLFVLSDGYAAPYKCKEPKKWFWFLTEDGSDTVIEKQSKIYKLKDFQ